MVLPEYRVDLLPNRATVVGDDSSWERMLLGSFVPGNETSTLSFPGTKRPLCGRFVPGNESAWERNVPVSYPLTVSRPISTVSVSFEHRTIRHVFIICTALFLSEVTVHCLLHGFLYTHLLIQSWCDIARNWVATVIERWRWCFML